MFMIFFRSLMLAQTPILPKSFDFEEGFAELNSGRGFSRIRIWIFGGMMAGEST